MFLIAFEPGCEPSMNSNCYCLST